MMCLETKIIRNTRLEKNKQNTNHGEGLVIAEAVVTKKVMQVTATEVR